MHSPLYSVGSLLVDKKGKKYLVLSYHRAGHQYERFWCYTVLSNGAVTEIDEYDQVMKDINLIDTIPNYA